MHGCGRDQSKHNRHMWPVPANATTVAIDPSPSQFKCKVYIHIYVNLNHFFISSFDAFLDEFLDGFFTRFMFSLLDYENFSFGYFFFLEISVVSDVCVFLSVLT